jgi:hypothetical protein
VNKPVLGRDVGKAYHTFPPVLSRVERMLFEQVELDAAELSEQLRTHPRLTYVIQHGGAISWLPVTVALIQRLAEHAPDRLGTGTFHKGLWAVPGVAAVTRFFSGAQRHLNFDELSHALGTGDCDFFAFPESDSSLYGDLAAVKPFRFHRFIELSVRARMPMLLVAHKGSEAWYRTVPMLTPLLAALPTPVFEFFHLKKERFLSETAQGHLNLPLPLGRISLKVRTEAFMPRVFDGLSDDPAVKKAQLVEEGDRIRARLQALADSI